MKDFEVYQGLLSYGETCSLAKKSGITPVSNPEDFYIKALRSTTTRCLDKIEFDPDDLKLLGVYLFAASEQQDEYDRDAFGLTHPFLDNGTAIIGLSLELIHDTRPEFWRIVFLHELGHLCGTMAHDETFQIRLNKIMFDFFGQRENRGDGANAAMLTAMRKSWKM